VAAPTGTASFSKTGYVPGELITLTVNHSDVDRVALTATVVLTDSTGATGTVTATCVIDPTGVTVTSVPARAWAVSASTLSQTAFTTTA
jgi:RPA family protein